MKKSKKIILRAIPVVVACLMVVGFTTGANVFGTGVTPDLPDAENVNGFTTVEDLGLNIWKTVTLIAQIAAFAAIIFAGVRYMFASADAKADIKKQTVILVVGAILVFGASTVVSILTSVLNDVSGNS